jgi:hypothetical protein
MPSLATAGPRTLCEICGRRVDLAEKLRYERVGQRKAQFQSDELLSCVGCKRRGCPECLRSIEDRADDFFFDEFLCGDCLRAEQDRG